MCQLTQNNYQLCQKYNFDVFLTNMSTKMEIKSSKMCPMRLQMTFVLDLVVRNAFADRSYACLLAVIII